jgi:hypothetical protein
MNWLLGLHPREDRLRWEVKDSGLVARLAGWAEDRNRAWLDDHVARGTAPPDRWKRRTRR